MLKQLRQRIVQSLWIKYRQNNRSMQTVEKALRQCGINQLVLDHFAIIDLPGPHSGIPQLKAIFKTLGFEQRGSDYLVEKQNDFLWMAERDSAESKATDALPQVVIADFRLDQMPVEVSNIIKKYAKHTTPFPIEKLQQMEQGSILAIEAALIHYFRGRDWPMPTVKEFKTVQDFNKLLAWVLVFGRQPNHFTLSVHLLNHFADLNDFHCFIRKQTQLALNDDGGLIKGGEKTGIAQGSTRDIVEKINLHDGAIELPTGFVEFVWRYPVKPSSHHQPIWWNDYFTGFIAQHADHVIESLYV